MKRIAAVCLLFIFAVASCAERSEAAEPSAEQLAAAVLASQGETPPLYAVRYGEDGFDDYAALYVEDVAAVADGVICYPYGVDATELAVLRFADTEAAETAEESATDYLLSRASAFEGYAPEQAALVESGRVVRDGRTVLLAIFGDSDAAVAAFEACMDGAAPSGTLDALLAAKPSPSAEPSTEVSEPPAGEPSPEVTPPQSDEPPSPEPSDAETVAESSEAPPETAAPPPEASPSAEPSREASPEPETYSPSPDDLYDHDAVLAAYTSGDASALTPKNAAIYECMTEAIAALVTDGMSDYEKELALHDYIIDVSDYDRAELYPGLGSPDPDNSNPYGTLINGRAICSGYSGTFQLFMDMLGIECITVNGAANADREEHAWNMVRLGGEWYCVDVTWDDPVGLVTQSDFEKHQYFNVTSEYLRITRHFWEGEDVPEATATELAWEH